MASTAAVGAAAPDGNQSQLSVVDHRRQLPTAVGAAAEGAVNECGCGRGRPSGVAAVVAAIVGATAAASCRPLSQRLPRERSMIAAPAAVDHHSC